MRRVIEPTLSARRIAAHALLVTGVLLCTACTKDPAVVADGHYSRAQEYLKQDKTEEAIIELRRAVQVKPDLLKARYDLAKLHVRHRQLGSAFQELSAVVQYRPDDREAHAMMAELLLGTGQFAKAKEASANMLVKWPDDVKAKLIQSESMIGLDEWNQAQTILTRLLQDDPKNVRARFDLAALDIRGKRWAAAEENLRLVWNLEPRHILAPVTLSRLLESRGNAKAAETVLKQLADAHAKNVEPSFALVEFYSRHRRLRDAEQVLQRIQTVGNTNPKYVGALAMFYAATGRVGAAEKELQRIVIANPEDTLNRRRLAEIKLALNRREEAREILGELAKNDVNDGEALLLLGRLELDDGKTDLAESYLNQAKAILPASPPLHFQLARLYVLQGKAEEAKDALRESLKQAPTFVPARIVLAELELRTGQTRSAIQNLTEALKRNPSLVEAKLLLSQAYVMDDKFRLAENTLQTVIDQSRSPSDQAMIFQTLASIKLRQGRFDEARELATKSLNLGLRTRDGLRVLGLSYLRQKRPDQGLQAVAAFLAKTDPWASGQNALGELAVQAGKLDLAESAYRKEQEIDPGSTSALFGLGTVHEGRRQFDLARKFYEQVAAAEPRNAAPHMRLAAMAEVSQDWPQAISEYKKAIDLDSSSALAKNNLAWLYAEHSGNVAHALRLAQEARTLAPRDVRIADTLAWIYLKMDLAADALPLLQECVRKDPGNPVYRYHLGSAYLKLGHTRNAREQLEAAFRLRDSFEGSADAKAMLGRLSASAK